MPAVSKISATPMKPLGERIINNSSCHDSIVNIFNNAQHVTSTDSSLMELKKLYRNTEYNAFIESFKHCLRNLLQSSQTNKFFFTTACDFVCNFLQYVSDIRSAGQSSGAPENVESAVHQQQPKPTRNSRINKKNTNKRKQVPLDELGEIGSMTVLDDTTVAPLETYVVTNHDRLMSVVVLDVINQYMQSIDDDCRCNAVILTYKLLSVVQSLDLEICDLLKTVLPKRMRDKKAIIRAYAVLASKTFQDCKLVREAYIHHFERDPEMIVRKALIQVMDTKVFKYGFLVDSTRDPHEPLRKIAYQRLGMLDPTALTLEERHRVIHNGLNERSRQAAHMFRNHTLEPWAKKLYDRIDLLKLLEKFDVTNHTDDMQRLVDLIYTEDLENIQTTGNTRLHLNVEWVRQNLLDPQTRLPKIALLNGKSVFVWLTLLNFCKKNSGQIQTVKLTAHVDADTNIERLIDTNENQQEEEIDLYERLTPDLVGLCSYIKMVIDHFFDVTKGQSTKSFSDLEFIYQQLMKFFETYEIGDELERRSVKEVFGFILKENLLTGVFEDFITPIIRCLSKMIYKTSPNLMVSWISDMINDVRSNLEDLNIGTQRTIQQSIAKTSTPFKPIDSFVRPSTARDIENEIASFKVDLKETQAEHENFLKHNNHDEAKILWQKMSDLKLKVKLLNDKRDSIAFSDIAPDTSCRSSIAYLNSIDLDDEGAQLFRHHRPELLKCLQMFAGCIEFCELNDVPTTMSTHLTLLSLEGMEWTKDPTIKSLVIRCTGLTALISKEFATKPGTMALLSGGCKDPLMEVRTKSYRCLVDVLIQHSDIEVSAIDLCTLFGSPLKHYGEYDPKNISRSMLENLLAIIEGVTKLLYFEKLLSPEILADLILWWYHPRTHSRVKQYIGVFLPILVEDLPKRSKESEMKLKELFENTFLIGIETLHAYILGPGFNIMSASDMHCMIRFMCNLIPVLSHTTIAIRVARRIRELSKFESYNDLCSYLIGAFACFDISKGYMDDLDDLTNALSELEFIIDRLSAKNKIMKAQYTKFKHLVESAERIPGPPGKHSFGDMHSTMIETGPSASNDSHRSENNKTVVRVNFDGFGQSDNEEDLMRED